MNSIFNRRSVRSFLDKKVEDNKVELLLKAAMQAPSAGNGRPWAFVVVKNKSLLIKLSTFHQYAGSLAGADFGIIVCANTPQDKLPDYFEQDLGAATQNILLEACELGLGAVWYGARGEERINTLRNMVTICDDITPFAVIGVGYPKDENANHFIDRFEPDRVYYID